MRPVWCIAGVLALGFAGCATSDDPREGGLIGYWQHGEQGYQQRLDQRREELSTLEEEGREATAESVRLEDEVESRRAELERQREMLAELEAELGTLGEELEGVPSSSADPVREEAAALQIELDTLEQDTGLLVKERRNRIMELKREMNLLRERASLLTTL